jgi:superfamily II DNA/RNA helicase
LILGPTRELTEQIYSEVDKFLNPVYQYSNTNSQSATSNQYSVFRALGICGGVSSGSQIQPILNKGVDIIVATPGRLLDLLDRSIIKFDRLMYLVFDEADRMLSMNLEEQLRKIVSYAIICARQTLLFSATMPTSVERLVRSAVLNPIYIKVGEVGSLAHSIQHNVLFMHSYMKKVILFCYTLFNINI